VVLFHRQFLNPEAELIGDRAKCPCYARSHLGVVERPSSLGASDQVVLTVVLRMTTRPPGHAGILS
jgi:hypothetical protein